jgi:ribonuclease BN (tRNA processing enzyme)
VNAARQVAAKDSGFMKLIFLGTGGSRSMLLTQERRTGGLYFDFGKTSFVIDPGPGSIVNALSLGLKPDKFSGVVISHMHLDHVADAPSYLDGIEEPFLIAEEHCVLDSKATKADFDYYPCIPLHQQKKTKVTAVKAGSLTTIGDVRFTAVKADHYDPCVGFRIQCGDVDVGYTADGAYYRGMEKFYDGCRILVINVVIPKGGEAKIHGYMSVDGIISLINAMSKKPQLLVLNHFNMWMLRSNLWKQEKIIQEATKLKNVIHSEDFMSVDLKTLAVSKAAARKLS